MFTYPGKLFFGEKKIRIEKKNNKMKKCFSDYKVVVYIHFGDLHSYSFYLAVNNKVFFTKRAKEPSFHLFCSSRT